MDIHLTVDEMLLHPAGKTRRLLQSQIALDESLDYDFRTVIRGIKLVYPNKQLIINFSVL